MCLIEKLLAKKGRKRSGRMLGDGGVAHLRSATPHRRIGSGKCGRRVAPRIGALIGFDGIENQLILRAHFTSFPLWLSSFFRSVEAFRQRDFHCLTAIYITATSALVNGSATGHGNLFGWTLVLSFHFQSIFLFPSFLRGRCQDDVAGSMGIVICTGRHSKSHVGLRLFHATIDAARIFVICD